MTKEFFSNIKKNNDVREILEKRLVKYGKMNFVYSIMNKRNIDEMMIISDLPDEIVDDYLNNKRQSIDPVVINALNRISPFAWDENLKINSFWTVSKVFDNIKNHDIVRGHAFVLHDNNNNLAMLLFYINKFSSPDVEGAIHQCKDEIQGLLIHIHETLLHAYQDEKNTDKNTLSYREAEVLRWCSSGKTYSEVATLLNITVSTVKYHMGQIVKKMGVKNAKHAISLGIEFNIAPPAGKENRHSGMVVSSL